MWGGLDVVRMELRHGASSILTRYDILTCSYHGGIIWKAASGEVFSFLACFFCLAFVPSVEM